MKYLLTLIIFSFFFFQTAGGSHAITDPRSLPNNRFGIHIIDENDLEAAAKLLNSSNGDWGYVKMVIREDDRKKDKWQEVFDKMRRLHLIPIVRLATRVEGDAWAKPRVEDIGSWVDFLDSLNWVTENRYVVIFNEPNHAKEWGHEIDPGEYGWYLKEFSRRLKEKSSDFFILPAGLDASAPDGAGFMDEETFLSKMLAKEPDVLDFIDGWSSHSYPNPGFIGSPHATGRGSIQTFRWEQNFLSKYGKANVPLFILETGWAHNDGKNASQRNPSPETVADYYAYAFTSVWNDPNIVAVVPFLLNYQDAPFDYFSWRKMNSSDFFPMYERVQSLTKVAGAPLQKHAGVILPTMSAEKLVTDSYYSFYLDIENYGQSIISAKDGWELVLTGLPNSFSFAVSEIESAEPYHRTRVEVKMKTPPDTAQYTYQYVLRKDGKEIDTEEAKITLVPPPSLLLDAKIWIKKLAEGTDFSLYVYSEDEKLLFQEDNVIFSQGLADIVNIHNIYLNKTYRIVLTKPYYLPRQTYATITESKTGVSFPTLLPLDPSNDGKLTGDDIGAFLQKPLETIGLFMIL